MALAVEITGLTYRYAEADRDALGGVEIAIPEGQAVAVLGPNGSGKSTLLKTIVTLLRPTHGDVRVFGHSTTSAAASVKRLVTYAPADERCHDWRLTGRANLELFAALYDIPKAARGESIQRAVHAVGILDIIDRPVRALSQGERQRLTLVRAFLPDALLVVLDEPFRSLDAAITEHLVQSLEGWRTRTGGTLIVAGHTISAFKSLCGTALTLDRGRNIRVGPFADFAVDGRIDVV